MLKVYSYFNSICTQKVFITLTEKGIEYATQNVDLFRNEQFSPEYLKINPKGVVPALDHDGRVVIESTLICEYLDECFPARRLVPQDPFLRARMRLWSKAVDEQLFEATRELSFSAMFRERMRNMTPELREKRFRNVGDPRRTDRFKSTYEHGVQSPFVLHAIAAYERAFKYLEETLAERGGPWVLGKQATLADINLMPFAARLSYLGLLEAWTAGRPHINEWWARVQDWPSFKKGLRELISDAEMEEMRAHGPKVRDEVAARLAALTAA